ncbi:MAG: flagellar export protein FliJ [Lachnospiraceae bacterium]|nr:flagellar export protein FliJ [Lachnospiraceae bacterium]
MAKFIYKMQNILDIKYKLEDQAKTEFSMAVNRLRTEEEKLEQIYASIEECQRKIRESSENKLNVLELNYLAQSVEYKKEQAKIQKKQVQVAEINVEKARVKLNEIMVDRKTHEKLKENAFEDFKREINEQESKEIDELVSFRGSK